MMSLRKAIKALTQALSTMYVNHPQNIYDFILLFLLTFLYKKFNVAQVNVKDKEAMTLLRTRYSLFLPLIDTYIVTAMSLRFLLEKEVTERDLMKKILNEVQTLLHQGIVHHGLYFDSFLAESYHYIFPLF